MVAMGEVEDNGSWAAYPHFVYLFDVSVHLDQMYSRRYTTMCAQVFEASPQSICSELAETVAADPGLLMSHPNLR